MILRTIIAIVTIIALLVVGTLGQGQVFAKTGDSHCWKQKLFIYTQPVQVEKTILCHTTTEAEGK